MPHIHDRIDFTVETFIVHQNRVLLRMHDKYKFWLSVGGHVELNEDPNQAAVREVKEEVGLDAKLIGEAVQTEAEGSGFVELIAPRYMNRHRISETHEHITLVYFATSETDQIVACDDELSDGIRWFTFEELADPKYNLKSNVRFYAEAALQAVSSFSR